MRDTKILQVPVHVYAGNPSLEGSLVCEYRACDTTVPPLLLVLCVRESVTQPYDPRVCLWVERDLFIRPSSLRQQRQAIQHTSLRHYTTSQII